MELVKSWSITQKQWLLGTKFSTHQHKFHPHTTDALNFHNDNYEIEMGLADFNTELNVSESNIDFTNPTSM